MLCLDKSLPCASAERARDVICEFAARYTHHYVKESKSYWKFHLIRCDSKANQLIIQWEDLSFERGKGRPKSMPEYIYSEQPLMYVSLREEDGCVALCAKLRWQKWKIALFAFCECIFLVIAIWGICKSKLLFGCLFLLNVICAAVYLIYNRKHDELTLRTFARLLQNNETRFAQ